jgi:hypothetical protein
MEVSSTISTSALAPYTGYHMPTPHRPDIRFDSYDQLLADTQSLHTTGWDKSGQWSLAMICDHLARWTNGMLDEGASASLPRMPGPFQWIARLVIRRMVRKQKYPTLRVHALAAIQPATEISEPAAITALTAAVARLQQLAGPTVQTHPFGPIDADDFREMALLHAAHHLAFLRVRAGG